MNKFPTISIIVPARNEEVNLRRLLPSLSSQTYPREKLEYLIINDGSTDKTQEMSIKFGARVIDVDRKKNGHKVTYWTEFNKGLGLREAKGEFVYWLDADMELCKSNFFQMLTHPLVENEGVIGSFTNEFSLDCTPKVNNTLLRFISYDPLQRDPIYQLFSNDIANTVTTSCEDYSICSFTSGKIPPCGRVMYRRKELLETDIRKDTGFYDLDALEMVVASGWHNFAYVPQAKLRHYHITSFSNLVKKRLRNLSGNFFTTYDEKKYHWFSPQRTKDILMICLWIVYANLFFPEVIRGLYETIMHRDRAFLWRPIVSFVLTDAILLGFIFHPKGRQIITQIVTHLFKSLTNKPLTK